MHVSHSCNENRRVFGHSSLPPFLFLPHFQHSHTHTPPNPSTMMQSHKKSFSLLKTNKQCPRHNQLITKNSSIKRKCVIHKKPVHTYTHAQSVDFTAPDSKGTYEFSEHISSASNTGWSVFADSKNKTGLIATKALAHVSVRLPGLAGLDSEVIVTIGYFDIYIAVGYNGIWQYKIVV